MAISPVCWHVTAQFTKIAKMKIYGKFSIKILKALFLISLSLAIVLLLKNFENNLSFKEYGLRDQKA